MRYFKAACAALLAGAGLGLGGVGPAAGAVSSTDLSVSLNAPALAPVGAPFTVNATVGNQGPDSLNVNEAAVTFTIPSGFTLGATPSGCTASSTATPSSITCPVPATASGFTSSTPPLSVTASRPAGPRTITATVSTTAPGQDPNPNNNTDSANVNVVVSTDLSAHLNGVPATSRSGVPFTVTGSVLNAGPSDLAAGEATVTISLGSGLAFGGPAPAGCTATETSVTCAVPAGTAGGTWTSPGVAIVGTGNGGPTTITASATTTNAGQDPVPGNNSETKNLNITPPLADLSLSMGADPNPVKTGSNLTYRITVLNTGPDAAAAVRLTDTLPAGVQFIGVTSPGWTCTVPAVGATGAVTCGRSTLANTASATVTLTVKVVASGNTTVTNTASVTASSSDPNSSNNAATVQSSVFGRR